MSLQYVPFSSAVDTNFWHKLSQLKLDVLRLSDEPVPLLGAYSNNTPQALPPLFNVDYTAFQPYPDDSRNPGVLINKNTSDAFKECDKAALLAEQGDRVWRAIVDGVAIKSPHLLNTFLMVTYADLKKYDFVYWFGFPAVKYPSSTVQLEPPQPLSEVITPQQLEDAAAVLRCGGSSAAPDAFVLRLDGPAVALLPLHRLPAAVETSARGHLLLGFRDPSGDPAHPGWPLRNLLALYWHYCGRDRPDVRVLCLRQTTVDGARSLAHSPVLSLRLSHRQDGAADTAPATTGWERNERGKLGARLVNLSSSMDPTVLASNAVDLNLKLMRWRLAPELDLDLMTATRCLLLGAGTLGCNVARALLGWGVRHITLLDSGVVSFSNPVRQSLFTFEDSVHRRPKAAAAAAQLRRIFPGVISEGVQLCVPMPGHPVSEALADQVKADVCKLRQLIQHHDVIFLLMDSRESRWLPTLMGAAQQKLVINAALGFDSYLVMRHGTRPPGAAPPASVSCDPYQLIDGCQLGCYFCSDVVAPGNSLQDRTLDQQCTVTRPGVSMVAAGLAVELAAALLQHPQRGEAPVSARPDVVESPAGVLGCVPHSVRGYLGQLQQLAPASRAFLHCTACSSTVLDRYREDGDLFLLKVFNQPTYLEEITGLTEMHQLADATELLELDDVSSDEL